MGTKMFVMVGKDRFEFDPYELVVSQSNIKSELAYQSQIFFNISFWVGKAKSLVDSLSSDLKIRAAELDEEIRSEAIEKGLKATDAKVGSAIIAHSSYREISKALSDAQASLNTLAALQQSYAQRKDCMIELARQLRAENFNSTSPTV